MKYFTTQQHKKFWKERKIDWSKHYLATWNHPHRKLIDYALKSFYWISLWEVGCGPAPNLAHILHNGAQGKQLGGSDVNSDAIELARKTFTGGKFHVESSDDLLLSDKSVDVVLSDAHLLYYGPFKIKKVIKEMTRVARSRIVLCELYEKSWWKRLWLLITTGYNAHDYQTLLEDAGCYNIQLVKIPPEYWEGMPWQPYGYIVIANVI